MLKVVNESSQTTRNIKIVFEFEISAVVLSGGKTTKVHDSKVIRLNDLKPGDSAVVHVWNNYGFSKYRPIKTYSSLGKIPIVRNEFVDDDEAWRPEWMKFIFSWGGIILFFILVTWCWLSVVIYDYLDKYLRVLFEDENYYLDEKIRFEENNYKIDPDTEQLKKLIKLHSKEWKKRRSQKP